MKNPLISIIIPVYNPGQYLYRCLDSIVNQTHNNLEIILVNDGSTDFSGNICDEYAIKDHRIVIFHKPNTGVSQTRNIGIDAATGDFYHFPDSDDYLELDTYESCLELIEKHHCDAIVFEHFGTYPNREIRHQLPKEFYGLYEGKDEIIKIYFRIAFTWNKFFKKKLITGSELSPGIKFREDIFRGEDGIFSRETLFRAERVWFTERPFYHYVQSEESACRGVFRPSQLSLIKTMAITKEFFREHFPQYIPKLEVGELESYIMLYADMALDEKDYHKECKDIYQRFRTLYKKKNKLALSKKQTIKFAIFNLSPALFSKFHAVNVKRLEG